MDGKYSIKNPYTAHFESSQALCQGTGGKETRHIVIQSPADKLPFEVGDSLAVLPENHPELVQAILAKLAIPADTEVKNQKEESTTLEKALTESFSITQLNPKTVKFWASLNNDLTKISEDKELLKTYCDGRDLLDLINEYPVKNIPLQELLGELKNILPRLYSIASSQSLIKDKIELTIAMVEWESLGRKRQGLCSTFLGHRLKTGDTVKTFIHNAKSFKLPENDSTDMIMIGPGTGVAPFRAFLQERQARGAKGKNWLFFGHWHRAEHFFYQEDWQNWQNQGLLSKIDLAFSRDQEEKIYVQHLMEKNAQELWQWIENGAHFYVCGDAKHMAKDVELALKNAIKDHSGMSEEETTKYLNQMKKEKRYQKDVY